MIMDISRENLLVRMQDHYRSSSWRNYRLESIATLGAAQVESPNKDYNGAALWGIIVDTRKCIGCGKMCKCLQT